MFRKTRLATFSAIVILAVLVLAHPASAPAQDLTSMFARFLVDLRAGGGIGSTATVTSEILTVAGIASTSTEGLVLENTTPATASATVQLSPRLHFKGSAYNSVSGLGETHDWIMEVIPATAAGATSANLRFLRSVNGGAYTLILTISSEGTLQVEAGNALSFPAMTRMNSAANGLTNLLVDAGNLGVQFNVGTAAATFNNGTITTGSRNMAGQVTLTGGNTGGTLTFGTPAWSNAPFCTVSGSAATDTPNITAASTTAFTIAGITPDGVFTYNCIGRI